MAAHLIIFDMIKLIVFGQHSNNEDSNYAIFSPPPPYLLDHLR